MAAAAPAERPVDAIFEKLATAVKNSQHKKALKTADEILALEPQNEDALGCKVASLIQQSEYEQALALLSKPALSGKLPLQKAYCLYRMGRIEEGLEAVKAVPEAQSEARLQLEAQLHYRLGANKECIKVYERLLQEHKIDSLEIKTNVLAAYVAAGLAKDIPDLMASMKVTAKQSFEVGFNKACGLLEAGEWAAAEGELRMALKLGRETLFEEDCSEAEVEEELAPLSAQLAYVLGRLRKQAEAQELYDKLLRGGQELSDETVKAVAYNNQIVDGGRMDASANHRKQVANASKRLDALMDKDRALTQLKLTPGLEARLSSAQKRALHVNRALLYYLSARNDVAKETLAAITKAYGDSLHVVLLRAALLVADGKAADADAALEQFSNAQPAQALLPSLMRAQLALEANQAGRALELLGSLKGAEPRQQACGAVLATRLALHQQLGDNAGAEATLEGALSFWQQHAREPEAGAAITWCLQALVGLKLKLGKVADAVTRYTQMQKQQDTAAAQSASTTAVLARLARALAVSDAAAAAALVSKELPSALPASELRGLDVDLLEEHLVSRNPTAVSKPPVPKKDLENRKRDGEEMADAEQQEKKKRAKRKRKPLLPKAFNPELPGGGLPAPDPERWLPKWQRSDFKKKKAKSAQRKNETVKGSQGAGKVDDSLDRTKGEASKAGGEAKSAKPVLPPRPAGKGKGKR